MDAYQSPFRESFPNLKGPKPEAKTVPSDFLESSLLTLINSKDAETFNHSNRVASLTTEWVQYQQRKLEWMEIDQVELVRSAKLHDLGKIGVLNQILNKADALTPTEKEHLNLHAEIGYQLVREQPGLSSLAMAIRHHHERWDGQGYPSRLKGEEIPLFSQIIALVDAYDAITSDRPYRKARTNQEAIEEIQKSAGRQFSPSLADAFIQFLCARNL
jgi:HD-GYP domain-containing protein (c-di-GMP phosphodiesterase class II)